MTDAPVPVSVVVPAYNEEGRLPRFLDDLLAFCDASCPDVEVVLVDDGSRDGTRAAMEGAARRDPRVRVLAHTPNRGKGYTVREGMLAARGDWILFLDADGATPPSEIAPMLVAAANGYDGVIGNRVAPESVVVQPRFRSIVRWGFNTYFRCLFGRLAFDSQCGFKGFRREVARDLFAELHDFGWVFDVEILWKARRRGYRILEIPIRWSHQEGSKLRMWTPLRMALQLLRLRWACRAFPG